MALAAFLATAVAAVGGRFDWATLPALVTSGFLLAASGARIGADRSFRSLDLVLLAALGLLALQLLPCPPLVLAAISPNAARLHDTIALQTKGWLTPSIHPAATRAALAWAIAAACVFWTSRTILAGTRAPRLLARLLAGVGAVTAVVAVAQHISSPTLLYWRWALSDPGAVPYGPFISRNHLATWMVMTISLASAALVARVRRHLAERLVSGTRAMAVALLEGGSLSLVVAIAVMLVALASTLSRSGFVALVAAAAVGGALSRTAGGARTSITAAVAAGLSILAIAAWANSEGVADRVAFTLASGRGAVSRVTIWRETLPIVRDFPAIGVGGGAFGDAMTQYQRTAMEVLFNHAHNEYLQLLTEGGVVLLAIVVAGLIGLWRVARPGLLNGSAEGRLLRTGACAGLAGVAVQNIWEVGLRTPANFLLAAALAGLIASNPKSQAPNPK